MTKRVQEIAGMLSGTVVTEAAVANAPRYSLARKEALPLESPIGTDGRQEGQLINPIPGDSVDVEHYLGCRHWCPVRTRVWSLPSSNSRRMLKSKR